MDKETDKLLSASQVRYWVRETKKEGNAAWWLKAGAPQPDAWVQTPPPPLSHLGKLLIPSEPQVPRRQNALNTHLCLRGLEDKLRECVFMLD